MSYALISGSGWGLTKAFQITGNNTFRADGSKAACITIKGKTISGRVFPTKRDDPRDPGGWEFVPDPNCKNYNVLVESGGEYGY